MTIDGIGPIDPLSRYQKAQNSSRAQKSGGSDSVSFSDEAKIKADLLYTSAEVQNTSDVRADRIAEVKKKLEDPNYIDDKVLGAVAERLMDVFEI